MRIDALEQIGGFNEDFWLDFSDVVVFHLLHRKRPEFPSGMALGLRTTMPSWVMSRKWELGVGLAGGELCRRSVGLQS
jgi:hypothetical protein